MSKRRVNSTGLFLILAVILIAVSCSNSQSSQPTPDKTSIVGYFILQPGQEARVVFENAPNSSGHTREYTVSLYSVNITSKTVNLGIYDPETYSNSNFSSRGAGIVDLDTYNNYSAGRTHCSDTEILLESLAVGDTYSFHDAMEGGTSFKLDSIEDARVTFETGYIDTMSTPPQTYSPTEIYISTIQKVPPISVTTDKKVYKQGESVNISVRSNVNASIEICDYPSYGIGRLNYSTTCPTWEQINVASCSAIYVILATSDTPCHWPSLHDPGFAPLCASRMYNVNGSYELQPGETRYFEWNQIESACCYRPASSQVPPGEYKVEIQLIGQGLYATTFTIE